MERAGQSLTASPLLKIAGRYAVEAELGRGGMASVYRALDKSTGRKVALKLQVRNDGSLGQLFEREYETLASLSHPRVIRAYDFGRTTSGERYYTMELLTGQELLSLSPLPWAQACGHLSDVCTSLALLHAQRLLHRDVNPRNVRLDDSGRAKLLDFGALMPYGAATEVVGTPGCIAPEVVRGQLLDGRADLYSLGAVAYYVLTGRTPYAIAQLGDAESAWLVPTLPPSYYVPGIPKALDDLVLSLLSQDPLGRPASAAETLDRLGAIAQLDEELLAGIAESHLRSAALVGRTLARGQLEDATARALRGSGGAVTLRAEPGMGRTRLCSQLAIDARIAGLTPVVMSGADVGAGNDLLRKLISGIGLVAPAELGNVMAKYASLGRQLGQDDREASERRDLVSVALQAQVATMICQVSIQKPLLLLIDDAQQLPSAAAGVLAMLTERAQAAQVLLVVTQSTASMPAPGVAQLAWMGPVIELAALDTVEVEQLLLSAFGDTPNRLRLAQFLMQQTGGRPDSVHACLRALVERGAIRYAGGTWLLPNEFTDTRLLALGALHDQRTPHEQLSSGAQTLLRYFALARRPLSHEVCSLLPVHSDASALTSALQELVTGQWLKQEAGAYQLAQLHFKVPLAAAISDYDARALHAALAAALSKQHPDLLSQLADAETSVASTDDLLLAIAIGLHWLRGGHEPQAHPLLLSAATTFTLRGKDLQRAAPELEAAVEAYREAGHPPRRYLTLVTTLALAGTYVDWRLNYRYGDESLALLMDGAGLKLAARLARFVGGALGLWLGLLCGVVLFHCLPPSRRSAQNYRQLLLGVLGIGSAVLGVCSALEDTERAKTVVKSLGLLAHFPKHHPVRRVHAFQLALFDHCVGRYGDARARCADTLQYLRSPAAVRALPKSAIQQLEGGVHILLSNINAMCTDQSTQETITALQNADTATSAQTLACVRAAHHGQRCELAPFTHYREQMDRLANTTGSIWLNDIQMPRMLWSTFALSADVLALKRAARQLDTLANAVPSVARLRDVIQACYVSERGRPQEALTRYAHIFEDMRTVRNARAVQYLGAYARILRRAGQPARALEVCELAEQMLRPGEETLTMLTLGARLNRILALIELGQPALAAQRLDALTAEEQGKDNPLIQGLLHGARAELALSARDAAQFEQELGRMRDYFRTTEHPALFAQCEALADTARKQHLRVANRASRRARAHENPQALLSSLATDTRSGAAFLFARDANGVALLAHSGGALPDAAALAELTTLVTRDHELEEFETRTIAEADGHAILQGTGTRLKHAWNDQAAHVFMLASRGALVLLDAGNGLQMPSGAVLEQLQRALASGE